MTKNLFHRVTILCDFDGTIVPVDLSELIFNKFAACGLFYSEQWVQGLIGTREEIILTFETISAGKSEIAASLAGIPIDLSFHDLLAFTRRVGVELAIVSDGLDWPIEIVLAEHGIYGLPIYSNHVVINGEKLTFEFPWYDSLTPQAGVCKPLIIRKYHEGGSKVVYIGDGRSDREAALEADLVFAKNGLADYCQEQGIKALHFNNFSDICNQVSTWLEMVKNEPAEDRPPVQR